jgi:putative transposase
MVRSAHGSADAVLDLYRQLLDSSWLESRRHELGFTFGGGLFSPALTIWLFVRQRLAGGCSLEATWLGCSSSAVQSLSPRSARAASGVLSSRPSGFEYARHALPLSLVVQAASHVEEEAHSLLASDDESVYLLDGTTVSPERSPELAKAFPPAQKSTGVSHWPVVLMVVAHDLRTGLASAPEWGPMYGPNATSELALAVRVLERLPQKCMVIADRNFGVFRMAWELRDRRMLLRMTEPRAKALLAKGASMQKNIDQIVEWKPTQDVLKNHDVIPKDAYLEGRLIVHHLIGPSGKMVTVCLFTTDRESPAQQLVKDYTARWNVETDLRSLKQTVGLETLRSRTPDLLAKEIVLAVTAYNLIRTFMALAAQKAGIEPRRLSFTRTTHCIRAFAEQGPINAKLFDELLESIVAAPLPIRKKREHPPRAKWYRSESFPARKQEVA